MKRAVVTAALVLALACAERVIWLSPQLRMNESAWKTASETYHDGWLKREERALCVVKHTVVDSVVTVQRFAKPIKLAADSISVAFDCTTPAITLHTHLIENGLRYYFSPFDTSQARIREVPFHILMSDVHAFSVLWKPADLSGSKRPNE